MLHISSSAVMFLGLFNEKNKFFHECRSALNTTDSFVATITDTKDSGQDIKE